MSQDTHFFYLQFPHIANQSIKSCGGERTRTADRILELGVHAFIVPYYASNYFLSLNHSNQLSYSPRSHVRFLPKGTGFSDNEGYFPF
jgi:hypothetical protein